MFRRNFLKSIGASTFLGISRISFAGENKNKNKKVYCKDCEYFDGWDKCFVPIINNNSFMIRRWYSSNKNDDVICFICETQNRNNDCKYCKEKI